MISIERRYTVMPGEVDDFGFLTAEALQHYFEVIGFRHSEEHGCGWEDMREHLGFWVISRIKVEIVRLPAKNEIFRIFSWPNAATATGIIRNYIVKDTNDEVIAKGMALWTVVSMITNKCVRTDRFPLYRPDLDYSKECVFPEGFDRIRNDYDITDPIVNDVVGYQSIDKNGHVNNAAYIGRLNYAVSNRFNPEFRIHKYQINYLSPLFADERVRIHIGFKDSVYFGETFVERNGIWKKSFQYELS